MRFELAGLKRWRDGLSLRQRLLGLFGIVMAGLLGLGLWESTGGQQERQTSAAVAADNLRARLAVRRMQRYYGYFVGFMWTQQVALGRMPPEQAAAELRSHRQQNGEDWNEVSRVLSPLNSYKGDLASLHALRPTADAAANHLEQILVADTQSDLMLFYALELDAATSALLGQLETLSEALDRAEANDIDAAQARLWRQRLTSSSIALITTGLLLMLVLTGVRRICRDIEDLTTVARRFTARDFHARLERLPRGELGELASAFVTMQAALIEYERELLESELAARTASQAKSGFLAAMSHEIRTPLIGVLGMLEVLGRSRLESEQRRQFNIVEQSARSLLRIVGDVLDYSKIEAGKTELALETLSLRDLVSRVAAAFSASAESRGLDIVQVVDPGIAEAHVGDGIRLAQVLGNFVSNAIKFTDKGSVIMRVTLASQDPASQAVILSVTDSGIGMSPEQVSRLFQPFTQAEAGTTRRYGGTGLGLFVCRRLAELMGGTVDIQSELGRGSTLSLSVRLPIGDPAQRASAAAEAPRPPAITRTRPVDREHAREEGSLLLLAEDHPINRMVLKQQLDLAGFIVETAETGLLALEKFRTGDYSLLFTDLHMPGLDGFQLVAAIREFEASSALRRTPVIALTAAVLREDVERCLAGGMDDYLSKPVTIQELTRKLRQWLPHLDWNEAPAAAQAATGLPVPAPVLASALAPDLGPLEHDALKEYVGSDAGRIRAYLDLYCKSVSEDLEALAAAHDSGAIASVAHRIRGAALMVGAREVAEIARQIEDAARQSRLAGMAGLTDGLRAAVTRVDVYSRAQRGIASNP